MSYRFLGLYAQSGVAANVSLPCHLSHSPVKTEDKAPASRELRDQQCSLSAIYDVLAVSLPYNSRDCLRSDSSECLSDGGDGHPGAPIGMPKISRYASAGVLRHMLRRSARRLPHTQARAYVPNTTSSFLRHNETDFLIF